MLDFHKERYLQKINHRLAKFPVETEFFPLTIEARYSEYFLSLLEKVHKTGMNIYCDLGLLIPAKVKAEVFGVFVIKPKKHMEKWFEENIEMIECIAEALVEMISTEMEKGLLEKENDMFRMEIQHLFLSTKDFVALVSPDGTIQEMSDSFASYLKKSRSSLIGEPITDLISQEYFQNIKKTYENRDWNVTLHHIEEEQIHVYVKPLYYLHSITSYLLYFKPIQSKAKVKQHTVYQFHDIKGVSHSIQSVIEMAKRVAPSSTTIMLRGESGTGKEVFAQSIHQYSNRAHKPFIAINCAAIPETLLESELFGYAKGAFTGAKERKKGRFELANGGTIFLDEIGDMSLHLQAKLLRVIQERKIEPVGDTKSIDVDVRIIAATHQNLEKLVKEGKFREDLYYRLNVIPITIPPLRERKEDIPILIEYFIKYWSNRLNRPPKRLSQNVYQLLLEYDWPGNVRELQNVIQHLVELEIGDIVTVKSLPDYLKNQPAMNVKKTNEYRDQHSRDEKDEIIQLLDQFGRDTPGKKKVAEALGISLSTLYRRMNKLKIK
ncbi:sigma-54 interaction domain-containing protein [Bacillus alveayuensis]|uniref:sigma-54 interaction domain-containing protein n=1 Tax=Aeribacillus alveayuensis TaxID=279215 RepID=UPI0006981B18|nr:sigma 54-interacting transcriptional regulator [Bacillus alveayuensis]